MSHYVECKPGFKDQQALIEALITAGFERSQIEAHEETVPLYGYQGDERPQRAHVAIRRQHVGSGANDVGWERSEYDSRHRFNPEVQARIKQEYAYHAVSRQQRAMGRTVERRMLANGEIEILIGGYR